jgi:asparagine synthase (glutamine-hydrolysing)
MLKLFGWAGAPAANAQALAAKAYFMEAAGAPLKRREDVSSVLAEGAGCTCIAPEIAQSEGVVAALRGQPIWRTDEPRIAKAPTAAHAVLQAYRLHGTRFLDLLHGSFAVAVIDAGARRTVLAVDRMGIEPLAYSLDANGLTFASSAEVVARAPGHSPRIRLEALLSYFFFHMIPSPDTVFEGVRKLPPATAVTFENGALSERTYWLPAFAERAGESFESLRDTLHRSLETGLRAARPDRETGAFLSGGLDSSTVAGYLAKVSDRPARTFSIGFGFEDYDELRYARIANARFGCESREYEVQPDDIVGLFATIARQYDEPFGNASALPTHTCARLARQNGITHLLAGDGGDELFAGNKRYAEQLVFERYQLIPGAIRRGFMEPVLGALPQALAVGPFRKARNYIAQANTPMPDRLESWNFFTRLGFDAVLDPQFSRAVDHEAPLKHMRSVFAAAPGNSLLNRMLHYDWRFTLADNDLRKVNVMCELAGVRVSYPMLHPDVIDLSIAVPPNLKMHGTELRTFYKRAMAGFLPEEILNKSKHGFGLPFGLWLERSPLLAELIDTNLAGLRTRGIIQPQFIDRLRALHGQEDARYYGVFVWTLSMLEQWFREHSLAP